MFWSNYTENLNVLLEHLQYKSSYWVDKEKFNSSKKNAYIGISLGIILWFVGFSVVGGEWFSMWQSADWNGLEPADRITTFFMLTYLALVVVD
jgi:predicted small integral membrane protein